MSRRRDEEEFCPRCWAGVASNQHHEQCVVTEHAIDGEPAAAPEYAAMSDVETHDPLHNLLVCCSPVCVPACPHYEWAQRHGLEATP